MEQRSRDTGSRTTMMVGPLKNGPDASLKVQVLIAAAFTALVIWWVDQLNPWLAERIAARVQTSAQESPEAEAARRYAAIIAGCLNGGTISDGEQVVECRRK